VATALSPVLVIPGRLDSTDNFAGPGKQAAWAL
jgi:hypothetical protein